MNDGPEDFTASIERAQRASGDVGGLFMPDKPGRITFEGDPRKMGPDLEHDAHVAVFSLPTDRGEYEDVLNVILRGEGSLRYEEKTFNKDGDFMVAVCWITPRVRAQAAPGEDAIDVEPAVQPRRIP